MLPYFHLQGNFVLPTPNGKMRHRDSSLTFEARAEDREREAMDVNRRREP